MKENSQTEVIGSCTEDDRWAYSKGLLETRLEGKLKCRRTKAYDGSTQFKETCKVLIEKLEDVSCR